MIYSTQDISLDGILVVSGLHNQDRIKVVQAINDHSSRIWAFEKTTAPQKLIKNTLNLNFVDQVSVLYPFQSRPPLPTFTIIDNIKIPVYWVIIDASDVARNSLTNEKNFKYYKKIYRQIALSYGIPIVQSNQDFRETARQIIQILKTQYVIISSIKLNEITYQYVLENTIQNKVYKYLCDHNLQITQSTMKIIEADIINSSLFQDDILTQFRVNKQFANLILCKWLQNGSTQTTQNGVIISRGNLSIVLPTQNILFRLKIQGESKKVYKIICRSSYFNKYVIILLKSTIYSHTNQVTAEIKNLGSIRAKGSILLLDLLNRNGIQHSYECVNQKGVILSQQVVTNQLEIVFKKEWIGTDKHSYYGFHKYAGVNTAKQYINGVYIRFDWRNPNHIVIKTGRNVNQNQFYYTLQQYLKKNVFFTKYLNNSKLTIPIGDKCIYPDIITNIIDLQKCRQTALKVYCTLQYHMRQIGLQVIDGCIMIDSTGNKVWSQLNPDCLRVKGRVQRQNYDKDIWRKGGSSSKEQIIQKWNLFNSLLCDYLVKDRYHMHDINKALYPYQQLSKQILKLPNEKLTYKSIYSKFEKHLYRNKIIANVNLDDKNQIQWMQNLLEDQLVSQKQAHLNSISVNFPAERIEKYNDIINKWGQLYNIHYSAPNFVIEQLQILLQNGIKTINISCDQAFNIIQRIPSYQIIGSLTFDRSNVNQQNIEFILDKISSIVSLGIEVIEINLQKHCFDKKELPQLIKRIPVQIKAIILKGFIANINDLKFLSTYSRVIPSVDVAVLRRLRKSLWIRQYSMIQNHDKMYLAIVIQHNNSVAKLIYLNNEALAYSLQSGKLHSYSLSRNQTIKLAYTIVNIELFQNLEDLLVFQVSSQNHQKFDIESISMTIQTLELIEYLKQNISTTQLKSVYATMLNSIKSLLHTNVINKQQIISVLQTILNYLKANTISLNQLLRGFKEKEKEFSNKVGMKQQFLVFQYQRRKPIFKFFQNVLGIVFEQSEKSSRNFKLKYNIVDFTKYKAIFNQKIIFIFQSKKDAIPNILASFMVDYELSSIQHSQTENKTILSQHQTQQRLILLKLKNANININDWKSQNKARILCQYPKTTYKLLVSHGINPSVFQIEKLNNPQGYFLNQCQNLYILCDHESNPDEKLDENLQIWDFIKQYPRINIALRNYL